MNRDFEVDRSRRRALQAGLAAGSLFLPLPYASVWAQSETAQKLLGPPKVGDGFTIRVLELFSRAELRRATRTVERVTDTEVFYSGGLITDLVGNIKRGANGSVYTDNQFVPSEFTVDKQWLTRYSLNSLQFGRITEELEFRVVAREQITVPAGTFNAFQVEGKGHGRGPTGSQHQIRRTYWWDPERVRFPVANEVHGRSMSGSETFAADRIELVSFKQS